MKKWLRAFPIAFLFGCAGISRDCNSCMASNAGGDWVILQYGFDGKPINCWKEKDVAIDNEHASDGIYWQEPPGHLVHISGWYNRVQVQNADYEGAARAIGVDLSKCKNGKYGE